ncbi:multidrug efflux MFS transporter MdtH [Chitinivorax sp. B]|uniref:multidrug efflux MFS transporter MdtH n=1 Tax=Chitinivorax sp. B TaxID=2502235 RepID=UPI0010F97C5B|nr:multidrug efflux MFS transporter MdtH [Chitinivorax sp. B]
MVPASRVRRLGKWFVLLDNVLVVFGFYVVFPLISIHFVDHLGWAAGLVGLSLALRQFVQQGLGIFAGSLADRYGAKPLIVSGMLLRAAGFVCMALATSFWWLLLSCVLSGIGGALFDPPRNALIVKFTRPYERGRFFSIIMMVDSAGAVAGALLGSWLLHFDFRWVGWIGAAIFLVAALCNGLLVPNYRVATRRGSLLQGITTVLRDRPYRNFVLTLSGYYLLGAQIMLLLPIAIKHMAGTPQAVGWMYTLDTILSLVLLYPLARYAEHRFTLQTRVMAGLALMTVSLGALAFASNVVAMFVLMGGFYIGVIAAEPARETLVAELADPAMRGTYLGFSRIGLALGGALGHLSGGWLYDTATNLRMPALPWVVLFVVGMVTLYALRMQFSAAKSIPMTVYQG